MKSKKQLKPGKMVQIWDHQEGVKMTGHGDIAYLVRVHGETGQITADGNTTTSGVIWQVISFDYDPPEKYTVHESWLNPIDTSSDIKRVKDE